jgi:sialic acid synthase SpsE/mannose-6-phosphate isomerase-like protein (cupin superfamily)
MNTINKPLIILEMANNHMGSVDHGKALIKKYGELIKEFSRFEFAFKFQYRNLDTFIHKKYQERLDLHYIKRFQETRLTSEDFDQLISEAKNNKFKVLSTPFDESSVDLIISQDLDYIKIASCSFKDWPLLEKIAEAKKPVVASTAGATHDDIVAVSLFFKNRNINLSLMHCVAEYPTPDENLHLSQIDYLIRHGFAARVGYSTHEDPGNTENVKMAVAKGAQIFEKHVGLPTEAYKVNDYSTTPEQFLCWLKSLELAFRICGNGHSRVENLNEKKSLFSLRRGIYLNKSVKAGHRILAEDVYCAFPAEEGALTANDFSKYLSITTQEDLNADEPLILSKLSIEDTRSQVLAIVQKVKEFIKDKNIIFPGEASLEISHHYGIDKFYEFGLVLITVVNREYCKKILINLPGQAHPEQYHNKKEESFLLLSGDIELKIDGAMRELNTGSVVTVKPGQKHSWKTTSGCILEEISSTHYTDDSFYTDDCINKNEHRKTILTFWF